MRSASQAGTAHLILYRHFGVLRARRSFGYATETSWHSKPHISPLLNARLNHGCKPLNRVGMNVYQPSSKEAPLTFGQYPEQ